MKKFFVLLACFLLFSINQIFAGFYARKINSSDSWWTSQILKFETKIDVYGLLYETTINVKLKLGTGYRWDLSSYYCQNPYSGKYEFIWNFSLPKNSYIKNLQIWDKSKQSFISAAVIDLSTAEIEYNRNSNDTTNVLLRQYMLRDYNGNYNLQYDMRISPVNWDESVEFIIKYVSPCEMAYDKRIIEDHSYQFYTTNYSYDAWNNRCFTNAQSVFYVLDHNSPNLAPQNFTNFTKSWTKQGDYWTTSINENESFPYFQLSFATEAASGKFLRTYSDNYNNFYQLATKPHISDELRYPRKIVIAFDLVGQYMGSYSRENFLEMIKEALLISTTEKDSLLFVTSDFDVKWLSNNFEPRTEDLISTHLNSVKQIVPKLNLLPYMLKDIVNLLNEKDATAEVWLVSDDWQTGVRAETVMELLGQTYNNADNEIVFNIMDASGGGYYYIQNKYYRGNEYLYENLTRLSGGNFAKLYDVYYKYYIDRALDCLAPKVSTVEIDPMTSGGFTYSRVNLNRGRNNFNITSRYYQLGMMEGSFPFAVNYYGNYLGDSYFNTIELTEDTTSISESIAENTGLYWSGDYIMNELFLQPQSYSTIKYIEELSTQNHLLTPYSGFIIPSPKGYVGFRRIYLEDSVVSVQEEEITKPDVLPTEINISAYPNPFNPQTTILIKLGNEALHEDIKLDIYNILGQKIRSYTLTENSNSSVLKVEWNGLNDAGTEVASGTYIAVLSTSKVIKSHKLLLVR